MIVGVLTTCHTQYTSDSSICIVLFNRTTLQVFVTYLTGALYVHPLWFHKHQCEFVCSMSAVMVSMAVPIHTFRYCTLYIIKENFENVLIHRCNYILLSQVYCVRQVVKTPTVILNNPVYTYKYSKCRQWTLGCILILKCINENIFCLWNNYKQMMPILSTCPQHLTHIHHSLLASEIPRFQAISRNSSHPHCKIKYPFDVGKSVHHHTIQIN